MIDFEQAVAGFPKAEQFPGLAAAWRWYRAPRWYGALAVADDGRLAYEMRGLDSFDQGLVRAVLTFARAHQLSKTRVLSAAPGFRHEPFDFNVVAACTPAVHRYHLGEDDELHARVIGVFPAFACEISGTETIDEANVRVARMLRPTILTRAPAPYLKMRYDNTKTRARSIGSDRGFTTVDVLLRELHLLGADAPDSFVEFENVGGEVRRVEWLDGTLAVSGASAEVLHPDEVDAWVDTKMSGRSS